MFFILLLLYSLYLLGYAVGKHVPDEITPARPYLVVATDVLLLTLLGIALFPLHQPLALSVLLVLMIGRIFTPYTWLYAPVSGIALGLQTDIVLISLLCLILNYLVGTVQHDLRAIALRGLAQPLTAGIVLAFV